MKSITPIGRTAGNGAKRRAPDQKGIQDVRALPDLEFDRLWESVILPPGIKDRLLAQGVLNFTARRKLQELQLPFHGIILLVGPPGTGKTSVARGLASVILGDTEKALMDEYGQDSVERPRRSVTVRFAVASDEERVLSFDVVPAFTKASHYEIPDTASTKGWTETNPKVHAEKATAANDAFGGEWKGMVRVAKRWNETKDKPVKPSFLLEVMALDILRPPFGGDYPYEFMAFFATAAERIEENWPDPAGLGPPVSDSMNAADQATAKRLLTEAHYAVREAIELSRSGRNGDALGKYRDLFGDLFPLS